MSVRVNEDESYPSSLRGLLDAVRPLCGDGRERCGRVGGRWSIYPNMCEGFVLLLCSIFTHHFSSHVAQLLEQISDHTALIFLAYLPNHRSEIFFATTIFP